MGATPRIFDIQRFSLHDGAGIRTTTFFKGCPLRCLWCHNPESWSFEKQEMFYADRCVHCGRCQEGCVTGARVPVGETYAIDDLVDLLMRDCAFYETSGGGVTLSGGEVMAQDADYVDALVKRLFDAGVSVNIDTCGYAPFARFAAILPYVDTFLYDVKAVDPALHRRITGVDNARILDNLRKLASVGARINLRVPIVSTVNDGAQARAIAKHLATFLRGAPVNLLPYHRLGADKRARLGMEEAPLFDEPTDTAMEEIAQCFRDAGFARVTIGG